MITSLKRRKIKLEPRIKFFHNSSLSGRNFTFLIAVYIYEDKALKVVVTTATRRRRIVGDQYNTGEVKKCTVSTKAEEYESRGGTSDCRLQISDFRLQPPDFRLQTSNFRFRNSDFRLETSDFRLRSK